jgi:hypothetical protein
MDTYLFGFEDGVLDLETNIFQPKLKSDRSCGWNYSDLSNVTAEEENELNKIIGQIFVKKNEREDMLKLYASCLNGDPSHHMFGKKLHINIGNSSGKSTINKLMMNALGQYAKQFSSDQLTDERYICANMVSEYIDLPCNANPGLMLLIKTRYAYCNNDDDTPILKALLHKLIDGENNYFRQHRDDCVIEVEPVYTLFMDCYNKIPIDKSYHKIKVNKFKSTFTRDQSIVDTFNEELYEKMERYGIVFLKLLLSIYKN